MSYEPVIANEKVKRPVVNAKSKSAVSFGGDDSARSGELARHRLAVCRLSSARLATGDEQAPLTTARASQVPGGDRLSQLAHMPQGDSRCGSQSARPGMRVSRISTKKSAIRNGTTPR